MPPVENQARRPEMVSAANKPPNEYIPSFISKKPFYLGEDDNADHLEAQRLSARKRTRSRSRSPAAGSRKMRTRSPYGHRKHRRSSADKPPLATLPFNSRALVKNDFSSFRPLLALYLDIQKSKIIEDLDEKEIRGRWKSFLGKWNRGELSEGWYDPVTFHKSLDSVDTPRAVEPASRTEREPQRQIEEEEADSDDSIGPVLPGQSGPRRNRMGPSIPNIQDLELKREMEQEDILLNRSDQRHARKADIKSQKAALDELVPRAEAGTRERQLEKKREVNDKMKSFREKSPGAAEVPDSELMGDAGGAEGFKQVKKEFEKKKNERELRREEYARARAAEREEKMQEYKLKEDKTMAMLRQMAKQNFG